MKIKRIKSIFHFDASYIISIEQRIVCLNVENWNFLVLHSIKDQQI